MGLLASLGLERYVRVRSRHYTGNFFSAVLELDAAGHKEPATAEKPQAKKPPIRKRPHEPEGTKTGSEKI